MANAAILANEKQFPKKLAAVPRTASGEARPSCRSRRSSQARRPSWPNASWSCTRRGIELNEIAVLYRAHYHSMEVQLELTRRGIPFSITSGPGFSSRPM